MQRREILTRLPIASFAILAATLECRQALARTSAFVPDFLQELDDLNLARCRGLSYTISQNHGHEVDISIRDLVNMIQKSYNIQGHSDHAHEITLRRADFMQLASEGMVRVESTDSHGHTHMVTIRCEASEATRH